MPPFSSDADDSQQVSNYHTLSVLALISLLLGLASPLYFVAPLLVVVPLAGIAISLIALRRLAASDGALVGRGAAVAGLALSVVCLLASISYDQVSTYLRIRQAREFGTAWIGLVLSGQTERAYQLTAQATEPPPPEDEPGPPRKDPYEVFLAHPSIRELQSVGSSANVRFDNTISFEPRGSGAIVRQQFSLLPPTSEKSPGAMQPTAIVLTTQRARVRGEFEPKWLVANYQIPAASEEFDDHGETHGHTHAH